MIYTPGVAGVSEAIFGEPDLAQINYEGNSVAIVTDSSAVLGLGNLGPGAALPVMEGKAVLFKKFGNIDAFPICLNVREPKQIIDAVSAIAPAFGAINLEDIASPKCFEIEDSLSDLLDIPVFHDDQHGTAIVTLAGLLNALRVVGKETTRVRIVLSGAGAAGTAIVNPKGRRVCNLVCDRKEPSPVTLCPTLHLKSGLPKTNEECLHGTLKSHQGADVFIGVSGPGLLDGKISSKWQINLWCLPWPTLTRR